MGNVKEEIEKIAELIGARVIAWQVEGLAREIEQLRHLDLEDAEPITVFIAPGDSQR